MSISELPKKKNTTEFTDKEIFLWLKDYISGWGSGWGVTPEKQYEIIKTELMRRNNKRMLLLTKVNVLLSVLIFILAIITFFK